MTRPLTLRHVRTRAVSAPMKRPLGTSMGSFAAAPLVLIDLETEEGVTGRAYLLAYVPTVAPLLQKVIADVLPEIVGEPVEPIEIQRKASRKLQLLGVQGVIAIALSGLDVACWDALAKSVALPLSRLLGGGLCRIPAYNSNGLGIADPERSADEALELLAEGFSAIKMRLGHPTFDADLAAVRAVRKRIPSSAILMSDYNHSLTTAEAVRRGQGLDGEGLYWIEEPTAHDDYAGNARVARAVETPIQIGENFNGYRAMEAAIAAGASDFVMPDLERIGGVTGWLKAAALAQAAGIEMSSHLFPEASAHLLAVTPTRHWLEYVDWSSPVLEEPIKVVDGYVTVPDRPGIGLAWDEAAVRRYAME